MKKKEFRAFFQEKTRKKSFVGNFSEENENKYLFLGNFSEENEWEKNLFGQFFEELRKKVAINFFLKNRQKW